MINSGGMSGDERTKAMAFAASRDPLWRAFKRFANTSSPTITSSQAADLDAWPVLDYEPEWF